MPNEKQHSNTLTASNISIKNGVVNKIDPTPLLDPVYLKSYKLESDKVFPVDPESAYLSSYFEDSYDFPYNPDPLAPSNSYRIYDEMKHDDQVKSAISFKKDLIVSPGWQIKCDDAEISDRLERNLRDGLKTSFENHLRDILSSFEYGFSLTECLYKKADDGLIEIKDFKTRPPHTFEFYLDTKGDVINIRQNTDAGYLDFEPDYFLHHIYQPEFGNPFGQSDLRAAYQSWKTKKFFFRFWAIYVERFAAPTVIGQYPSEFDSSKVARLQAILNTIQNSTSFVVPEGTKIDFNMPQRDSSNIYENGINMLNTMIARAILMPDLMGISGSQTNSGSRSLGEVQFDLFMSLVKREQDALSRVINIKVLKPLVKANWGDIEVTFEFKPRSKNDALEALKVWVDATRSGLWKPAEEEIKHALETMKFPVTDKFEVEEDEPMEEQDKEGKGAEGGEEIDDEVNKESFTSKLYREQTKYEKAINFKDMESYLDTVENKEVNKLTPLAKDIYMDYIDQIKERNLLTRFKPELINELKIHQQKSMNIELKMFMKNMYMDSYNKAQKEFFPKVDKKFTIEEELLPEEFLEIIEAEAFKLIGDYSIKITNSMKNRLVNGIKNGINEKELVKQLRELGQEETERWLKTVIRTKSTEMFNRGRKSFWDNDEYAKQIVVAYQFSAIMDSRTSEVCSYLDGKVFDKGEYTTQINPPLHFNCRSVLIPISKFEEYESNKEVSLDSLKDKGGNLLSDKTDTLVFQMNKNTLLSGSCKGQGDKQILEPQGRFRMIHILYWKISNMSTLKSTTVSFHHSNDKDLHYKQIILPAGSVEQDFRSNAWRLPLNTGFIINLSTDDVPVEYTIEYKITT